MHTVVVSGDGAEFPVADGQTVLDAALRNGAWLPHSCTQGTCGTCKLRVLCGEVDHGETPVETLPATDRQSGMALGCMAVPRSDLTVQTTAVVDGTVPRHRLRDHEATVVVLDDIAADTRRLILDLDDDMQFTAGQYCELVVPGVGVSRQYSMANPPGNPRRLEFHIKRTPGGMATDGWIFKDLAVDERIALRGPLGQFGLSDRQDSPVILIGGGTGLAPLKSIVHHALEHDLAPEMFLYHGGRRRVDLYDVEYFTELAQAHPGFHYRPALSEPDPDDGAWTGSVGMVTDVVLDDFASCKGMSAYLCGPPAMVTAAVKALKRRRMAPRLIFREEFTAAPVGV
ncbi:2Fe-2S iron-sulfur cluster-binding protein [Gordonia sp. NPDC003376]